MIFDSSSRCRMSSCLVMAVLSLLLHEVSPVFAADEAPITKTYDDSFIMSRVQLVGVIAGGSSENSGIAVIKDLQSGRSYAVKTGDSLPGVSHIVLTKVQREVAVFKANEQEYSVRINIGSSPGAMPPSGSLLAGEGSQEVEQLPENKGPGLFEKWAAGAIERGADLISLDKIKNKKPDTARPAAISGAFEGTDLRASEEQDVAEDHIVIDDDSDEVDPAL
jgi:hypothetical protein